MKKKTNPRSGIRLFKISDDRSVFADNTFALGVMQVVKYVFPLITLPYLARVLGSDGYALRAYVVAYMVFMQTILDYGFSQYGTKAVALRADNRKAISEISGNAYVAKAVMALVAGCITIVATVSIPIMRSNPLFVAASFVSVVLKALLPDFVLQGLQDMRAMAVRYAGTQTLALALIFILIRSSDQILLVPVIEGAASLIAVIWSEAYLRRRYEIKPRCVSLRDVLQTIEKSTPFFLAVAASSFMANTITVLMGVFSIDALTLSCWSIASTILAGIQAMWQPISRSLFPHMVKKTDYGLVRKLLLIGTPIIGVLAVAIGAMSDSVMMVMGGSEYVEGSYVLRGVLPTLIFSYPISILGYPVIGALGKPSWLSVCVVATALSQFLVLMVAGLSGHFTIEIIIAARVGSEALLCLLEAFMAMRVLRSKRAIP